MWWAGAGNGGGDGGGAGDRGGDGGGAGDRGRVVVGDLAAAWAAGMHCRGRNSTRSSPTHALGAGCQTVSKLSVR